VTFVEIFGKLDPTLGDILAEALERAEIPADATKLEVFLAAHQVVDDILERLEEYPPSQNDCWLLRQVPQAIVDQVS